MKNQGIKGENKYIWKTSGCLGTRKWDFFSFRCLLVINAGLLLFLPLFKIECGWILVYVTFFVDLPAIFWIKKIESRVFSCDEKNMKWRIFFALILLALFIALLCLLRAFNSQCVWGLLVFTFFIHLPTMMWLLGVDPGKLWLG